MFEIIDSDTDRTFLLHKPEGEYQIKHFEEKVYEFIKHDERDVSFDLKNMELLNSTTLAAFIRIKRALDAAGRSMKVVNYNESILRVMELSGLDNFLLD